MLTGCKFIVMTFCLMNKEKALRSVLAMTTVYVVKLISYALRYSTKTYSFDLHVRR